MWFYSVGDRVVAGLALAGFLIAMLFAPARAEGPVYATGEGAIRGYDPVAYFTDDRPVRGLRQFHHRWRDETWYFASAAHRDRFIMNPEEYAPSYGGYCAFAMSKGEIAVTNPHAFAIVAGRLYLNNDKKIHTFWLQKTAEYIEAADKRWERVAKQGN